MTNIESFAMNAQESMGKKIDGLKMVIFANKLYKELEAKSMAEVLKEHLPVSDDEQLRKDADEMCSAIDRVYGNMGRGMTKEQVESHLNRILADHSENDRGLLLVNLLKCAAIVNNDTLQDDSGRWLFLKDATSFDQDDIAYLKNLAVQVLDEDADFMARQEFLVMEKCLAHIPESSLACQMNSGSGYARSYAAAMYIANKQSPDSQPITAAQIGLVAANSVESSSLMAKYHYGKITRAELMAGLKDFAMVMLTTFSELLCHALAMGYVFFSAFLAEHILLAFLISMGVSQSVAMFAAIVMGIFTIAALVEDYDKIVEKIEYVGGVIQRLTAVIFNFLLGKNIIEDRDPDDHDDDGHGEDDHDDDEETEDPEND